MPHSNKPSNPPANINNPSSPQSKPQPVNEQLKQISQQFNLLLILFVALFFFQVFMYFKLKKIETNGVTAGAGNQQQAQGPSPLDVDKLKAYAKDLKLDTGKFNKCLDDSAKKKDVEADTQLGSSVGVQGTPGFFVNGRFLAGAFPFEFFKEIIDKELAGTATTNCADYSEQLKTYCEGADKAFNPEPKQVDVGKAPMRGKADARVTIVEFSDFECPFCQRAFPTVEQILKEYPNDVKLYYKQFPLSFHPHAQKAAEAAECAEEQGKFWEYHDKLFKTGGGA